MTAPTPPAGPVPLPAGPWPPERWPTAPELAAYLAGLDAPQLAAWCALALPQMQRAERCAQEDHAGMARQLRDAAGDLDALGRWGSVG